MKGLNQGREGLIAYKCTSHPSNIKLDYRFVSSSSHITLTRPNWGLFETDYGVR